MPYPDLIADRWDCCKCIYAENFCKYAPIKRLDPERTVQPKCNCAHQYCPSCVTYNFTNTPIRYVPVVEKIVVEILRYSTVDKGYVYQKVLINKN